MKRQFKAVVAFILVVATIVSTVILTKPTEANALTYSGSSYYMAGKYYQNLIKVELTGNPRVDIVNVAASQIGYQEGANSTQLDGTLVANGNNYTEYGRWWTAYSNSSYNHINSQWCAMFVSWCAYVAGISSDIVTYHQYTESQILPYKNAGRAYDWSTVQAGGYTPEAGDIVYFYSGAAGRTVNHVGIVTGFSNNYLYTIEGNTSGGAFTTDGGACANRSYYITDTYVRYICRPNYSYTTGVKQVTASSLNIRDAASSSGNYLGYFSQGERFNVLEVVNSTWGRINYFGHTAYVSIKPDYVSEVMDKLGWASNHAIVDPTDVTYDSSLVAKWANRAPNNTTVAYDTAGYTSFTTTGAVDPYVYLMFDDTASFTVDGYRYLSIVAKTTSKSNIDGKMFLMAGTATNPSESIAKNIDWIADGQWHEYLIDISDLSLFTGYFHGFRFDYFDGAASSGDSILLRSIKFIKDAVKPTVTAPESITYGEDMTITYSGMAPYSGGSDSRHPYMAIYKEGTRLGVGSPVLWNYIGTEGTMDLKTSFTGTYSGQDLPVGKYTVYLTYNTTGKDTFISDVMLGSATAVASFSVNEVVGDVEMVTGGYTKDDAFLIVEGTLLSDAASDIEEMAGITPTIYNADGSIADFTSVAATGMYVDIEDGLLYNIIVSGDVDGDGLRNVVDVTYVLNCVRGTEKISDAQMDALEKETNLTTCNIITATKLLNSILNITEGGATTDEPEHLDLGTNFTAQFTNLGADLNLSLADTDVIIYNKSTAAAQKYVFNRQDDGSYMLINTKNYYVMTAESATDGANVYIAPDQGLATQRWFIQSTGEGYVIRNAASDNLVLMPQGSATEALTSVVLGAYQENNADSTQLFYIVRETSYATGEQIEVLRNIIYAVETGGQVYGRAVYDCLIGAYTNSDIEYAITIGAGQWYGTEALRLLNTIYAMYPEVFTQYDPDGVLLYDMQNLDWSTYDIATDSTQATIIKNIIATEGGKACQDMLLDMQMQEYLAEAADLGVTELKAMMMCANIRHQGGASAVTRVLGKTTGGYTLENIYAALQTDTGNQVGTYTSRQKFVYENLKLYIVE